MNSVFDWLCSVFAAVGGILAWFFGPWDALIMVLVAFVVADYITGLVNAALHHTLSSAVGFKGLWKKALIFLLVGIGTLLDSVIPMTNGALRTTLCLFYIANEALSILENAGAVGLPLPEKLKTLLEQLEKKSKDAVPIHQDPEEIPGDTADGDGGDDGAEGGKSSGRDKPAEKKRALRRSKNGGAAPPK